MRLPCPIFRNGYCPFLFCAFTFFCLAHAGNGLAQESFRKIDESRFDLSLLDLGNTHWHGIYIGNKKSGYMSSKFERREKNGKKLIASITRTELKLLVQGRATIMSTWEEAEFEAEQPYRMVSASSSVANQLGKSSIKSIVTGNQLVAQIEESGVERRQVVNDFQYTLPQVASFNLMDFERAKPGDRYKFTQFGIADLQFDKQEARFVGTRQSTVNGVSVKFYEADVTSEIHKASGRFRFGADGELLSAVIGGVFELRREPESDARNFGFSADLAVLGVLRIDRPIGDPRRVASLELLATPKIGKAIQAGPMQRIELQDNEFKLKLGSKYGTPKPASAATITENLKQTADYPKNDPQIQMLTKRAIGQATDTRNKVRNLLDFVSNYLEDSLGNNAISIVDIIRTRRGDCTEHAKLFTTMARAAGIPAREVGGFIYLGDDTRAFGAHAWNEVVIDGKWLPVDPMWNEININATHIQLDDYSQLYSLGAALRLLNVERR